ncbi:MAG TPA: hypothetical protein VH328_10710 [Burkholderiaceae bacterium]|nr:hypothetical protein [Burkholderiaceae bacterium]
MKHIVLAASAALGLAAGSASAVPVASHLGRVVSAPGVLKGHVLCENNGTDSGTGIASETFTDFSGYDSSGAADCRIKAAAFVTEVDTLGQYFNGSGPANSVTLTIYKDKGGLPGKVVAAYPGLAYTDSTGVGGLDVKFKRTLLTKGTYWFAVQPSMTFAAGGQWGWELQSEAVGAADLWEEQGGLGTGCLTWAVTYDCVGYAGDYMFIARGIGE